MTKRLKANLPGLKGRTRKNGMNIERIRNDLASLLEDESLFEESNLYERNETITFIKYAGDALKIPGYAGKLDPLYQQALAFQERLAATNEVLFQRVRGVLRSGEFTPKNLRAFFNQFTDYVPENRGLPDYKLDSLDLLLEEVIFQDKVPHESRKRKPGMIRYEATPARVILEMIDSLQFTDEDLFYDLGSGMGLVAMMVNLLTGVRTVGIEYDPSYCEFARSCAEALDLKDVNFIHADVRNTDLNAGNIFYMFTPFVNKIFDQVMEQLRYTAIRKDIYLCSYGTITYDLVKIPWLQIRDPAMEHDFKLAIFTNK